MNSPYINVEPFEKKVIIKWSANMGDLSVEVWLIVLGDISNGGLDKKRNFSGS